MLIKLDKERVEKDGKYDYDDMWRIIDGYFEGDCNKEIQSDGAVLYSGILGKDDFTRTGIAFLALRKMQWFADYCIQWMRYDIYDNEVYEEEDVLKEERRRNPLFVVKN